MSTAMPRARFAVLGVLEVEAGGYAVELATPRLRLVLALLIAAGGHVVGVPRLVEELWGQRPPDDADRTVRAYVSRLRKALGDAEGALIQTRPPGYVLHAEEVDARRFQELAAAGRRALAAGEPVVAAEQLAAGLALWRGEAYAEFGDSATLRAERVRLSELRLAALADRVEADLATGAGPALVAELETLTLQHPGHERLWANLMTALYRAGRQSDALAAFRRARAALIEQTGLEPSPGLAEIHQRVLAQDPALLPPRAEPSPAAAPASWAAPAQLPPALSAFTGRAEALARLDAALPPADGARSLATAVVSGPAGVGKTALTVHWAHRVAERFPDGQLYVDLRGFDRRDQELPAAQAVGDFLDALGVAADRIPASEDAQIALYRSLLAGKRMLVVLDNARDAEHARPLLPGTAGSMAVITSRSQLTSLVADGALPVNLDVLPPPESRNLLVRLLGPTRVAAEPRAVAEISARCGGLPLALTIVAARAATNPGFPLAGFAAELADAGGPLESLAIGEPRRDIRAVFSWSYRALSEPAARLFRLLGLHPGPDIAVAAAASLAGEPRGATRQVLAELTRASLLTEHTPGRYAQLDLLHAYAADLAGTQDSQEDRAAAVRRMLEYYVHTAYAADRILHPGTPDIRLPPAPPSAGVRPDELGGPAAARGWLAAEQAVFIGLVNLATRSGLDELTWQLAWTLERPVRGRAAHLELVRVWRAGERAAERLGDPIILAGAYRNTAYALGYIGRYAEAGERYLRAIDIYAAAGDRVGEADAHQNFATLWGLRGEYRRAIEHAERAAALKAGRSPHERAYALNSLGWYYAQLGDYERALVECGRALELFHGTGRQDGEAGTWDSLGYTHRHLGDAAESIRCYRNAIDIYAELGATYDMADSLSSLGDAQHEFGDDVGARASWQQSLQLLTELDHPDADAVRRKLFSSSTSRHAAG